MPKVRKYSALVLAMQAKGGFVRVSIVSKVEAKVKSVWTKSVPVNDGFGDLSCNA